MAVTPFNGAYRMGARVHARSAEAMQDAATIARRDDCSDGDDSCDGGSNTTVTRTLPIVLGVVIPIIVAVAVLYFFHRRGQRRQAREEAADPNQDLDFGLNDDAIVHGRGKKGGRKSVLREKVMGLDPKHRAQISMDMNLDSPYLLPPALQGSKESLHSLTRNLNSHEDPYRPVGKYSGEFGGSGSMRSFRPDADEKGSSIYTKSTPRRGTVSSNNQSIPPRMNSLPSRQNSLPQPPAPVADPFATPTLAMTPSSESNPRSPPPRGAAPEGIVPEIGTVSYPDANYDDLDRDIPAVPSIMQPPQAARKDSKFGGSRPSWGEPGVALSGDRSSGDRTAASTLPGVAVGLGLDDASFQTSPPLPTSASADLSQPLPSIIPEEMNAHDDVYAQGYHDYEYQERGRSPQRLPIEGNLDSQTLGVPQQENKRLSVGLRPLPPDEVTDNEDPEERANRIRSFYKEYFDDSKPDQSMAPPLPTGAPNYEDYDSGYLGADSAFYDPSTNAFVMPYAQPVTRRAMTPPPSASRRKGPPPPRVMHGSMSGGPGGRRGPPGPPGSRGGSGRWGTPTRPGSSMSSAYGPPRPGSSASNRYQRQAKPKAPPPSALTTLPTPSKLKDDSMALIGSIDFAPPTTYIDRQRGRSQSPMGERRPYAPQVPVASPLVSSFDELASVPSPHMLRKSGTFTALDFAPPRKFANDDSMSDAGSIRSNRSGLSAAQAHAIRGGAGRVSRLPDDTVFTNAKSDLKLKPSWDMRAM